MPAILIKTIEYDIKINNLGTFYYKKGTNIVHREDGPAIEYNNGDKEWWVNNKRHREDGPAIEWVDGEKWWWINGKRLSPEKEALMNVWWNNTNGI